MIKQFENLPECVRLPEVRPYFESLKKKSFQLFLKRAFDIFAAAVVLIILSPVLLIAALCVAIGSKGPVFYLQERVGKNGKPFKIIKFRTMIVKDVYKRQPCKLPLQNDHRRGFLCRLFKQRLYP